jgi:thiopeptide-type bacteriocin biosynthesis protein
MYKFTNKFIIRSPLFPLQETIDESQLFYLSQSSFFKEAIYLSSPQFYKEMIKWHEGKIEDEKRKKKILHSAYKYMVRMQSRCTPFGLFAGCGVGSWAENTKIEFSEQSYNRHARLDMELVGLLANFFANHKDLTQQINYFPNDTTYVIGDKLRYVDYNLVGNKKNFEICSVDNSYYLDKILSRSAKGARIDELVAKLVSEGISSDEAEIYITELIRNKIIINEFEPAIGSNDPLSYLIIKVSTKLRQSEEIIKIINLLNKCRHELEATDNDPKNNISRYENIKQNIKEILSDNVEENSIIQVDSYLNFDTITLNNSIQGSILETINFLSKIGPPLEFDKLVKFKNKFYERYGMAEVPLLNVLDPELGIEYNLLKEDLPGLNVSSYGSENSYTLDARGALLLEKYLTCTKEGSYSVEFTDNDVINLKSQYGNLQSTKVVAFQITDSNDLIISYAGGISAACTLMRFANGDKNILSIVKEIAEYEELFNSNKIVAELLHLPQYKYGNILQRPSVRSFEIPFLCKSTLNEENQIMLSDLLVSLKDNKIVLKSKKHGKEVLPYSTTAHNYKLNSLPLYEFLCDLQLQNSSSEGGAFSWGSLSVIYKFLPRVKYKNVIISAAKWLLQKNDYSEVSHDPKKISQWRAKWQIPQYVTISEGDNFILIDFENNLAVDVFYSFLKKEKPLILTEHLFNSNRFFPGERGLKSDSCEYIGILIKDQLEVSEIKTKSTINGEINLLRKHIIGDEWLYYKIYCGQKTIEEILIKMESVIVTFKKRKVLSSFFFIRYYDTDYHLRFRFKVKNKKDIGLLIKSMNLILKKFIDTGEVHKVQTDTYTRELERYGKKAIKITEELFHIDSSSFFDFLKIKSFQESPNSRLEYALLSIDNYLDSFHLCLKEKGEILELIKVNYINLHWKGENFFHWLNSNYRQYRKFVEDLMMRKQKNIESDKEIARVLAWEANQVEKEYKKLKKLEKSAELNVSIESLLISYIHMKINRIYSSDHILQELIVYNILHKYYTSLLSRTPAN